ncbi:PREDICTED: uncharacterized protein LOC109160523 [Ipomoea nil]|uniref:uncharacterized protein LOC109160523 n=1 Tax=Ipomoea nil TaxID=35883 RepID=UPI00090156EE|nr:PREDICTED: uncharacterized protein LOC109160523 [Ipomoea nil]
MAPLYIQGKDLGISTYKKAIRLRLVRTYNVPEGRNSEAIKSQECFMTGTYVHGNIPKDCVEQFSKLLKEGKVYAIKDFAVISHYYQYKTTDHTYMIRFTHETHVERHRRKGFPNLMFRIKSFSDLMSDVIGIVVEFYSPKQITIAGFPSKLLDFLIEDGQGCRIKCTVWDHHVDTVMDYFKNHVEGPLIILLQLCRAKQLDSKCSIFLFFIYTLILFAVFKLAFSYFVDEVRISSSYNATQLWFNHDCKEFKEFKDSLKVAHSPPRSIQSLSVMSYVNSAENSKSPMVVTTIKDLYERAEEGYYWVPARIVSVESTRNWYYHSCRADGCFKKLHMKDGSLLCQTCRAKWQEGTLRYKLVVRVGDKTTDAPFLLWDKEGCEIVGTTAFDLRTKYSMMALHYQLVWKRFVTKQWCLRFLLKPIISRTEPWLYQLSG